MKPDNTDNPEVDVLLSTLNKHLMGMGMLEMLLIHPNDAIPAPVNARYFLPETMRQLVDNVRNAGHLESVPLVYRKPDVEGKVFTISGHHRIEAAKAAGLAKILVLVTMVGTDEEIISKQLAHNALVGQDDPQILLELFNNIKDLQLRLQTGLSDSIQKVAYPTINFKLGATRQFVLLFVPQDAITFERGMDELEELARSIPIQASIETRVLPMELWDRFAEIMRKVKGRDNIKSNSTAFLVLLEMATKAIDIEQDGIKG